LAPIAAELCKKHPRLRALNHLQSWDIGHVTDETTIDALKHLYKAFHHTITNAYWLTDELQAMGVQNIQTAQPGVEKNLWYPKDRDEGDERPTVLIHLSEQYPFRGYERGVETAKHLLKLAKDDLLDIRVIGVGCHKVAGVPEITCYPLMAPTRLAKFIGTEVDLVLDPSHLHSYGLPCLEAIASGVEIASWNNKGIHEYGNDEYDIILHEDAPPERMAEEIYHTLTHLRDKRLDEDDCYPSREEGVNKFISCLKDIYKYGANKEKKLVFVTPHVRKFGGPHTIIDTANLMQKVGYDTTVAVVYADSVNLELTGECEVPLVFGIENIPNCDIIFVPSDSDKHEEIRLSGVAKKRVLLKLGHNKRFQKLEEDGLNGKYDKVITSTQWLKDVTETCSEGWTYETQPATKVGWYNYGFRKFNTSPDNRSYHKFKGAQVVIAGLVHQHPLKGTKELINIFKTLHERHGNLVKLVGVGEVPAQNRTNWMTYIQSPSRSGIHDMFSQVDIWVNCSHTEGLGRMSLEAMSAGCAVVATDTGCEYMEQKINSLIFPIGDVKKGVYMVEKLLNSEKLLTDIVLAGYETAKVYADPVEYATQLETVVKELL
jgi:glycosyltransferase involved in cell wall biosynthesis